MKISLISAGLLLGSTLLLNACSTPNKIQRHLGKDAVIEQFTDAEHQGTYRNLYRTPVEQRQYPANCEVD